MLGKVFIGILALFLLFGVFASPISDGIKGWRSTDNTQNFVVATAGGVTTANVTLNSALYQDNVTEVISVSSNETEFPVATSYDEATKNLLISALNAASGRTLTVEYYGESDSEVMQAIGPFLGFLVIGGLAFAVIYGIWKGRKH
jgi:anti-sigma-K factor RskA